MTTQNQIQGQEINLDEIRLEKLKYFLLKLRVEYVKDFDLLSSYYAWLKSFILAFPMTIQATILDEIDVTIRPYVYYLMCVEKEEIEKECVPQKESDYFPLWLFITKYIWQFVCMRNYDCFLYAIKILRKLLKKQLKEIS